jgi:uncharacterized caspase-like protein
MIDRGAIMKLLTALFWAVLAFAVLPAQHALAEKRVALVMGNSAYKYVTKLTNPANDSAAVATLLRTAGFDVVESKQNLSISEMKRTVRDFTDMTKDADIAVVYYAGHGIEVDGVNYMVPVDAELARDIDVEDEAVSLDRIVRVLDPVKRLRLVILDACRDNPFGKTMKRTIGTRSIGRGLAKVEVQGSDTMIAFAAKAGSTASDGDGSNSPFASALVNNLGIPGLDLRLAFGRVRDDVLKATGNKQEPFVYGSLGGTTVSLVPALAQPVAAAPVATPALSPQAEMRHDFELAASIGTREAWDQFLAEYSNGLYAGLARAARAKLAAEAAKVEADAAAAAAKIEGVAKATIAKAQAEAEAATAAVKSEAVNKADAAAKAAIAKAQAEAKAAVAKSEAEAKATAEKAEAALATLRAEAAAKLEAANKALDAERAKIATQQVASLTSQDGLQAATPALTGVALIQEIKKELKRVGCYAGQIDEDWKSSEVKRSLAKFAKIASLAKTPEEPDAKFLNSLRGQITRVCPIECGKNEVESGGKCIAKVAPTPRTVSAQADSSSTPDSSAPIGPGGRRKQDMNWNAGGDTRVKCGKFGCSTWKKQ